MKITDIAMVKELNKTELPALRVHDESDDSSCRNHSKEGGPNLSDSDLKYAPADCGDSKQNSEFSDEETTYSILKMVEFYLSDAYVLKNTFLLKQLRQNKEGYVSIKLLASFKKLRSLCRSWKELAYCVQNSKVLVLNSDGTKVRRMTPLPDHDETAASRSVIVYGFSNDKPSVDNISEMFAQCGDIALIRILRPKGSIPSDVKRSLVINSDIQSKTFALIEFEEHASAQKALESEQADSIKVIPVLLKKRTMPASFKKEVTTSTDTATTNPSQKECPKKKKTRNRKGPNAETNNVKNSIADDQKKNRRYSCSTSSQNSSYVSSSFSSSYFDSRYPRRHNFNRTFCNDPNSSFASLNKRYNGSWDRFQRTETEEISTLSNWRQHREQQIMLLDSNQSASSNTTPLLQSLPVKTIRLPKGPDGTKGFHLRHRKRLPSTAE